MVNNNTIGQFMEMPVGHTVVEQPEHRYYEQKVNKPFHSNRKIPCKNSKLLFSLTGIYFSIITDETSMFLQTQTQ